MGFVSSIRHYLKNNCGASAIEFALLVPLLILVLIGTVDYGFFITERMQLQNTAHAAADYVSQSQDDENVQTIADEAYDGDYAQITLTSEFVCQCADGVELECPVACDGDDDYQRRFVNITASRTFAPIFPYPGIPNSLPLQTSVKMRVD